MPAVLRQGTTRTRQCQTNVHTAYSTHITPTPAISASTLPPLANHSLTRHCCPSPPHPQPPPHQQLLFLLGITLLIGFKKTLIFFRRPTKLRGTLCFLGGIALVLAGWPVVGMVVEVFGILNLFGNFFPIVLSLLRNMPVVGPVLQHPVFTKVSQAADRLGQRRHTPV